MQMASRTNTLRRGQYLRALTAYADPPALLVGYYFRQGNTPPDKPWEEKKLSHEAFRRKANT